MNIFKVVNLPVKQVTFKEWKVKENSKLAIGSAILIYEYTTGGGDGGTVKTEKIKSHLNEITVKELYKLNPGDKINAETALFSYEKCKHPITSNDMCAVCGEDLRVGNEMSHKKKIVSSTLVSTSTVTTLNNSSKMDASVRIVHAEPKIRVSETEALEIGKKDLMNLVKNKKLVLLVDLDHTLIHTTNENVRADLKDVHHYELMHRNAWYHTKFRPNCDKFLEEMSKLYELHMVTFGERNYAHTIAKLMDPDHRHFHDRILSRNEIFNPVSKTDNLKDLFPRGDLMVCIIDDREDVWNYARNLICVQPYVFFKNTGDINDPNQQKQELQKSIKQPISTESKQPQAIKTPEVKTKSKKSSPKSSKSTTDQNVLTENLDSNSADSTSSNSTISSSSSSSTNSKSDSNMESGFDMKSKANNKQQNKENNQTNKTKHTEQQDQENDDDYDPDDYLVYLENILRLIHDEYYRIYEQRLKSKSPATTISNVNQVDEADLPDLKKVLPLIKSKVLENVVITFSGVVPTGYDLRKQRCYLMATSLGAKVNEHLCLPENTADTPDKEEGEENKKTYEYSYDDDETSSSSNCSGGANSRLSTTSKKRYTTHLVAAKYGTSKVHEASKCSGHKINVVTPEWLINSNYRWMKCDEKLFGLTKEYDYKNCMFHNEYNMHQKLSAVNNPHIIQPPKQLLPASKRNINNVSINQMNKPDSESKTKKYKLEEENSNSYEDMKINEDLLMSMDKEVEDQLELDDDDEEGGDDQDEEDDDDDDNDDEEEEDDENQEQENNGNNNNSNNNASDSASSSQDEDADLSSNDIDDDMILALEKDFS